MVYDVIVVGARVAGASLALLLGRQGRRVLLVDRDRFPSDTLSTHLLAGPVVASLARLGVLEEVESSGLRRLTRTRTHVADCLFEGPSGGQPPHAYALAPRRDRLDSILIQHAIRHPTVEFRERTAVEGLLRQDGRVVGVTVQTPAGGREEVRSSVVAGADGRHSRVAEWVGARDQERAPALRPGYYAYFHGVAPLAEPTLELFHEGRHTGFVFPMEPDVDCLAMEIQPEDFESFRQDLAGQFEGHLRRLPGMADRMVGASRVGPIYGARGIDNYLRDAYGAGWVLTGDAAYCKDPITGTGIGDAFAQAFLLADALGSALDGADWEAKLGAYQSKRNAMLLPFFRATLAAAGQEEISPEALAWLRALLINPFWVSTLAAHMPTAIASPGVFSEGTLRGMAIAARGFGASPTVVYPANPRSVE